MPDRSYRSGIALGEQHDRGYSKLHGSCCGFRNEWWMDADPKAASTALAGELAEQLACPAGAFQMGA